MVRWFYIALSPYSHSRIPPCHLEYVFHMRERLCPLAHSYLSPLRFIYTVGRNTKMFTVTERMHSNISYAALAPRCDSAQSENKGTRIHAYSAMQPAFADSCQWDAFSSASSSHSRLWAQPHFQESSWPSAPPPKLFLMG